MTPLENSYFYCVKRDDQKFEQRIPITEALKKKIIGMFPDDFTEIELYIMDLKTKAEKK